MKSPLAEPPIWHHLERRVDTHIFLCVLAYHLLISIEKTLLDNNVHTSWATIRDILKTHQICTIVLPTDDGACLRICKAATPTATSSSSTAISVSPPTSSRRSTHGARKIVNKKILSH
jgi:hypothetical protein